VRKESQLLIPTRTEWSDQMTEIRGMLELGWLKDAQDTIKQCLNDPDDVFMYTEMELAFMVVVAYQTEPIKGRRWEDPKWVLSEFKRIDRES